jgi:segregation and condensation protein A
MNYQIRLEMFEGPFELLLYLIEKEQMDIFNIPIAKITQQFIEYLQIMRDFNLEVASSFLLMASTLLALKAKMLLPAVADEQEAADLELEKQQLIDNILYYKAFKEAAQSLQGLQDIQALYTARPEAKELYMQFFAKQNPLAGKDINDLLAAYAQVLAKLDRPEMVMDISFCHLTVESKIEAIIKAAKAHKEGFLFGSLFADCRDKREAVVTFLALLELLRKGVLQAVQDNLYADIYLYPRKVKQQKIGVV